MFSVVTTSFRCPVAKARLGGRRQDGDPRGHRPAPGAAAGAGGHGEVGGRTEHPGAAAHGPRGRGVLC